MLIGDVLDCNAKHNSRRQNYGDRRNGPWVFGFNERGPRKSRVFYVENRKRDALLPIILANVHPESHVISDQWAAYATLRQKFREIFVRQS